MFCSNTVEIAEERVDLAQRMLIHATPTGKGDGTEGLVLKHET